jgi:hypothetical protein
MEQAKKLKKPEKSGKKWSPDEEENLLGEIAILPIEEVAKIHQRTAGAIRARLLGIALNMIENGEDLENVLERTKTDADTLEKSLKVRRVIRSSKIEAKPGIGNKETQLDRIEAKLDKIITALNLGD